MTEVLQHTAGAKVAPALAGTWMWVHETLPATSDVAGFDGLLVRAANGNGTTSDHGFDYKANFAHCVARFGQAKCAAWTFLYPATTHGVQAADALLDAAPHAPAYIADVEDYPSQGHASLSAAEIAAFVNRLHAKRPGVPVGFTSYPSKHQAEQQHVNWDALINHCDFGAPQIYFAYQLQQWQQIVADHKGKPIHAAFSPADAHASLVPLAKEAAGAYGGISIWLHPLSAANRQIVEPLLGHVSVPAQVTASLPVLDLWNANTATVRAPGVRRLQGLLAAAGKLDPVGIDGAAGATTRAALLAFKAAVGLEAKPVAGAATWKKLLEIEH